MNGSAGFGVRRLQVAVSLAGFVYIASAGRLQRFSDALDLVISDS